MPSIYRLFKAPNFKYVYNGAKVSQKAKHFTPGKSFRTESKGKLHHTESKKLI